MRDFGQGRRGKGQGNTPCDEGEHLILHERSSRGRALPSCRAVKKRQQSDGKAYHRLVYLSLEEKAPGGPANVDAVDLPRET